MVSKMLDHNLRGKEMSLKNKLFAGVVAVSALTVAGMAQDTKVVTKDGEAKVERKGGKFDRGMRGHKGGPGMRGGHRGMGGLRGITLTDAQKEQMKQIHEANKPSAAQHEEMKTLMTAKRAGTATAEQEARLKAIRGEGKAKAESVRAQIENILTAEQKTQLEQKKAEMKTRMQERRTKMEQRRQERKAAKPAEVKKDN